MFQLFVPTGISIMESLLQRAERLQLAEVGEWRQAWQRCLNEDHTLGDENQLYYVAKKLITEWRNDEARYEADQPLSECCAEWQSTTAILQTDQWKDHPVILHLIRTSGAAARVAHSAVTCLVQDDPRVHGVEMEIIETLGTPPEESSADFGLQQLIAYIHQQLNRNWSINGTEKRLPAALNITSGFKSLASALTLVGQLLGLPIYYLYEVRKELIQLPPLPLTFDWSRMEIYRYWLLRIQQNPVFPSSKQQSPDNHAWEVLETDLLSNQFVTRSADGQVLQLTYLGKLLDLYIRDHYPYGRRTTGLALEFLFYEHFVNEGLSWGTLEFQWVNRQVRFGQSTFDFHFRVHRYLDGSQVFGELCSYGQLLPQSERPHYHFLRQLRQQLKDLANHRHLWGYLLLIYRFEGMGTWSELFPTLRDISTKMKQHRLRLTVMGCTLPLSGNKEAPTSPTPFSQLYHRKLTTSKDRWRKGEKHPHGNPYLLLEDLEFD